MNKTIKTALESYSREQLLDLLDMLCVSKEIEKHVKLLTCPTTREIERLESAFERSCRSLEYDPCSERIIDRIYEQERVLFESLKLIEHGTAIEIMYRMYNEAVLPDACYEIQGDIQSDCVYFVKDLYEQYGAEFTNRELYIYAKLTEDI